MPIITEEQTCVLSPKLTFTQNLQKFYGGVQKLTSGKTSPWDLNVMEKVEGDTWLLRFSRVPDDQYKSPRSFNMKLNKIGKEIFGEKNFRCSDTLFPNNEGTGIIVYNWAPYTTCKIKHSSEANEHGKIYKHIERITFPTKDTFAPMGSVPDIKIRNSIQYDPNKNRVDTHKIFEDFYWDYCKN